MYVIELVEEKDIKELTNFFSRVYNPSHITTSPEYLNWQYRDSPYNHNKPKFSGLVLKKDKTIVGFVGMIPYDFIMKGNIRTGAFLANLIVDSEYRSHGAGSLLVREAEKYFNLVYAASVNEQGLPALLYNDWSNPVTMTRFVYDLKKTSDNVTTATDKHVTKCTRFDTLWDESWRRLRANYKVTIDRSSDYLNWRYINNPFIDYHVFVYKDKDKAINGYIVVRIEEGNEFRACRIVDFIADGESITQLLQHVLKIGDEMKLDFVDFFCWPETYSSEFRKSGFYLYNPSEDTEPPPLIMPTRRKMLSTNLLYKVVDIDNININETDLFVTKGDGDRDRPNKP